MTFAVRMLHRARRRKYTPIRESKCGERYVSFRQRNQFERRNQFRQ